MNPANRFQVAIIGAGITGLSAAYWLRKQRPQTSVIVLEASNRPGGKVRSEWVESAAGRLLLEAGADAFLARQKPWAYQLALELGLADEILPTTDANSGVYIVNQGRLQRLPPGLQLILPTDWGAFAGSGLFSPAGMERLAQERQIPVRKDDADESIASFVTRRLGQEALEKLGEPLLSGIYSARPEEQSLLATFPRFRQMEQTHGSLLQAVDAAQADGSVRLTSNMKSVAPSAFVSFRDGTETLAKALAASVGNCLRLNHRVNGLAMNEGVCQIDLADGTVISAESVLVTVPARQAARLLGPDVPVAAGVLDQLRTVSSGVAYLAFRREDVPHPLDGFGVVVPRSEQRDCNALTFVTSKFAGRAPAGIALIRYFFGGARTPHLMEKADGEITETARTELDTLLGIGAMPLFSRVYRWWDAQPQYDVGHLERMQALQDALPSGIHMAGTAYGGVGIPDCVRQGQEAAKGLIR